ncbi:unnamed protein product [Rotaria sp. Silwood2]|nr:unnamed protein product [Rotaria sp. Silwood2]
MDALLDDLEYVIKYIRKELHFIIPLVIYAHGTGCISCLAHILQRPKSRLDCQAMILSTPSICLKERPTAFKFLASRVVSSLAPSFRLSVSGNYTNEYTTDKETVEAYRNDPLVHDEWPAQTVWLFLKLGKLLETTVVQFTVPVMIQHGADDNITPIETIQKWVQERLSAINRIQSIGRSRLKIDTLDMLMTVRMLLKEDIRSSRCQQVVTKAFKSWNDRDQNRRLHQIQLLRDVPDDYTPTKQVRSVSKRNRDCLQSESIENKKKKKSKYIKCKLKYSLHLVTFFIAFVGANGCKREVSGTDPRQNEAIQCCHQNEQFQWIDFDENCSRWLCNYCRIKLSIKVDSIWFCDDHIDIHCEENENDDENFD